MRLLRTCAFVLIFLTCFASSAISLGQTNSSDIIYSSGAMNYGSSSARMVYSTSFEKATIYDPNRLDLEGLGYYNPWNWFSLNTGTFWIENKASPTEGAPAPRTGSKSLGLMVPAGTGSAIRSEFELVNLDGGGSPSNSLNLRNEAFFSIWLWLPPDWTLNRVGNNWYEICNPFVLSQVSGMYPRTCLHILKPNGPNGPYSLALKYYSQIGVFTTLGEIKNFAVPRGEWFNIKYWIKLSETNGAIKMWISTSTYGEDYLIADASGIQTKEVGATTWLSIPAKVYLDGDSITKYLYADDLEVWDGLPAQ